MPEMNLTATHADGCNHDPMALAKTPRQRQFVRFLQAIADMSEDDLREALDACPTHIATALAHGPKSYRYDCAICDAFGRGFFTGAPDAADPMWRAWGYHEVPKLKMRRADDRHYGPHANATYERCLTTYRVAGWGGAPDE